MAQFLTSNTLIKSVKRRAMIPENQATFQAEDFLAFANEEISMGMVPLILQHHEDFFMISEDVAVVGGQSAYPIPYRAIGNRLREVSFRNPQGNITELTRIEIQDVPEYNQSNTANSFKAFYIQNNKIIFIPELPSSVSGTIVFSYYIRPNEMVAESRTAIVKAIDTNTGVITVEGNLPTDSLGNQLMTTSTKIDFIQKTSPHITLSFDKIPSATDTTPTDNTITFGSYDSQQITLTASREYTNIKTTLAAANPVNDSLDRITLSSHGFNSGDTVLYSSDTTDIGGLISDTVYYALKIDNNTFQLEATLGGGAINLTSDGAGTHTFSSNLVDRITNSSLLGETVVNGSYFSIVNNIAGTTDVFWYNVDASGISPNISGTLHEINVLSTNTDTLNTTATKAVLDAAGLTNLTISASTNAITITENSSIGSSMSIGPVNLSFVITTLISGESSLPSELAAGDYINLAEECIVPQIPADLHMQLAQRVAVRCLEAMGDLQGAQFATAKLGELNQNASSIIDNRVEGAPRKISNRHTFLRRRYRFGR